MKDVNMKFHACGGIVWNSDPFGMTVLSHHAVHVKPGGDVWIDSGHEIVNGSLCFAAGLLACADARS